MRVRPAWAVILLFVAMAIPVWGSHAQTIAATGQKVSTPPPVTSLKDKFVVFDATLYKNKPDLSRDGIRPLNIIYAAQIWKKDEPLDRLPEQTRVQQAAREAFKKDDVVAVDIEQWPVTGHSVDIMEQSVEKYVTVLNWMKEAAPKLKVGYFANVPVSDFRKSSTSPGSFRYLIWQSDNNRVKPIAAKIDVAFPAAYTYSTDRELWKRDLLAQVTETRRIFNGPIYVFIWPQYFDHAPAPAEIQLQYMPADDWKFELEAIRQYADGVVIWGGWDFEKRQPAVWDAQAPWWQVTKEFVEKLNETK